LAGGVFAVLLVANAAAFAAQAGHPSGMDTLAVVGSRVITGDHFARLFREKVIRLGLTDNGDTRQGYLRNLVDDEVLIAEAKKRKLDRSAEARSELSRIRVQELLNAFTERHIASAIAVSDEDLKDLYAKINTRIKVRHLYGATKSEAESLYADVTNGGSFEEIARRVFSDPQLRESGGSLGYITIDEMDPQFEAAAYSLRVGEVSRPVKTAQGYSILRVDDVQRNPFLTETEFLRIKENLKAFARKRQYEQALAHYTAALRSQLDLRFNESLVARLFALVRHGWPQTPIETSSQPFAARDLAEKLVRSEEGGWSTRKVLEALRQMTEAQRKWIRTQENLEDVLAGIVIREHIVDAAKQEGLDAAPAYGEHVEYAFDTYLLTSLEDRLKDGVQPSEDSLRAYYAHNRERYKTEDEIRLSGILVDSLALADSIRSLLQQGAAFDLLAKRLSIQNATAEHGGDLGFFTKKRLGNYGDEVFALGPGEWKGPFVQEGKYLFVKCTEFKGPTYKSFEESAGDIEKMLLAIAWNTQRSRYVETFRKTMECRVYPGRLMTMSVH
jgi:parvulin-like peptidyl-prolyl isomerase